MVESSLSSPYLTQRVALQTKLGLAEKLTQHKGCSTNYPLRGGPQALFFCPVGGGCFVDVSEGWVGNLSWGSRRIWSIVGRGLIKALTCPEGLGALTPCVSWGWRGLEKMRPTHLRIISGTDLIQKLLLNQSIGWTILCLPWCWFSTWTCPAICQCLDFLVLKCYRRL